MAIHIFHNYTFSFLKRYFNASVLDNSYNDDSHNAIILCVKMITNNCYSWNFEKKIFSLTRSFPLLVVVFFFSSSSSSGSARLSVKIQILKNMRRALPILPFTWTSLIGFDRRIVSLLLLFFFFFFLLYSIFFSTLLEQWIFFFLSELVVVVVL